MSAIRFIPIHEDVFIRDGGTVEFIGGDICYRAWIYGYFAVGATTHIAIDRVKDLVIVKRTANEHRLLQEIE